MSEDQVPEDVKAERLQTLQQLISAQQFAFNQAKVGEVMDILIERPANRADQMAGRSPWMQAVHFRLMLAKLGILSRLKSPKPIKIVFLPPCL